MHEKLMLWPTAVEGEFQPYLEVFLLDSPARKAGLVLVCPGGGYKYCAEHEGNPVAERFNRLGWNAAVVQYRVAPATFPDPQLDALRAIKIIRANADKWNVEPDNIAILGFSAGGHLAACCGTIWPAMEELGCKDEINRESPRPDAMILCYPVISLGADFGHVGSGKMLMGSDNPDPAELEMLRLDLRVSKATPPTFLWHTAADASVPVKNSIAFAEAMWKNQCIAELHVFPRGHHGLGQGLADDAPKEIRVWPELADTFLREQGFVPGN